MYISSISHYKNWNTISQLYSHISSSKRIETAGDDPAGLAISKKMETQSTLIKTDNKNMADSQSLLNTVDGHLDSVTKGLQRIKELAIQGSNGIYTSSDRELLQSEIDQIKEQINSTSQSAQYNGISILNGTTLDLSGVSENKNFDLSTDSLGITDFDITKSFDIRDIDKAIDALNSIRGDVGASTNAIDHATNSNDITYMNLQSAQSRIEDVDMERMVMELRQEQLRNTAGLVMQKNHQQEVIRNGQIYFNMLV